MGRVVEGATIEDEDGSTELASRTSEPLSVLAKSLSAAVRVYQHALSPILPPSCRFTPTCSAYALEALSAHGALRASWLATKRIARCHPFCKGGYDPVPPARHTSASNEPPVNSDGVFE